MIIQQKENKVRVGPVKQQPTSSLLLEEQSFAHNFTSIHEGGGGKEAPDVTEISFNLSGLLGSPGGLGGSLEHESSITVSDSTHDAVFGETAPTFVLENPVHSVTADNSAEVDRISKAKAERLEAEKTEKEMRRKLAETKDRLSSPSGGAGVRAQQKKGVAPAPAASRPVVAAAVAALQEKQRANVEVTKPKVSNNNVTKPVRKEQQPAVKQVRAVAKIEAKKPSVVAPGPKPAPTAVVAAESIPEETKKVAFAEPARNKAVPTKGPVAKVIALQDEDSDSGVDDSVSPAPKAAPAAVPIVEPRAVPVAPAPPVASVVKVAHTDTTARTRNAMRKELRKSVKNPERKRKMLEGLQRVEQACAAKSKGQPLLAQVAREPIQGGDERATKKSQAEKVSMLKHISTMPTKSAATFDCKALLTSPSVTLGAVPSSKSLPANLEARRPEEVLKDQLAGVAWKKNEQAVKALLAEAAVPATRVSDPVFMASWGGDNPNDPGFGQELQLSDPTATSSESDQDNEDEEVPVGEDDNDADGDDEIVEEAPVSDESYDEEMDRTSAMGAFATSYPKRFSIFAPSRANIAPTRNLMDVPLVEAKRLQHSDKPAAESQVLSEIIDNPLLSALFGQHLGRKGVGAWALFNDLREMRQVQTTNTASRLPTYKQLYNSYLSDAGEMSIDESIIPSELRQVCKKRIFERGDTGDEVWAAIENVTTLFLESEFPKFTGGALYKTLGRRQAARIVKGGAAAAGGGGAVRKNQRKEVRPTVDAVFETKPAPVVVAIVPPVVAAAPPVKEEEEEDPPVPPMEIVGPVLPAPSVAVMPTIASMDDEDRELYASFVMSTSKKDAPRVKTNVAFLSKVAQFNKSVDPEKRREVAGDIHKNFLEPKEGPASRSQDVDISLLRKQKLVSQYKAAIESKSQAEFPEGFFDKAAKDVEAYVEPTLKRFIQAKKEGSIIVPASKKVVTLQEPAAGRVGAVAALPEAAKPTTEYPDLGFIRSLRDALDEGGEVLKAFCVFAKEAGHYSQGRFLIQIAQFQRLSNAAERTTESQYIIEDFIRVNGTYALEMQDFKRVGLESRWVGFSKRHMIKVDFFDEVVGDVCRTLETSVWKSFVAACRAQSLERSKKVLASKPVPIDDDPFDIDGKQTLVGREEIAREVKRRLTEDSKLNNNNSSSSSSSQVEHDEDHEEEERDQEDGDEGVEDSPDRESPKMAASVARRHILKPVGTLDLSPTTASNLLSQLTDNPNADTLVVRKNRVAPMAAGAVFASSKPAQVFIRSDAVAKPAKSAVVPERKAGSWPARACKILYCEGTEGKKKMRFVLLKSQVLSVWSSEASFHKHKEPKRALDMNKLGRCTIVRDNSGGFGPTKWDLRLYFEGLNFVVVLASESHDILKDWRVALLDSAPQAGKI